MILTVALILFQLALNWNLGEEIRNSIAEIKDFANFLKSLDPYRSPIVAHNGPYSVPDLYERLLGDSNFDGPSFQSHLKPVFNTTLQWVQQSAAARHKWLVTNDEQKPARDGVKPDSADPEHDEIRQNVLWANIMAGGSGVEYFFGPCMEISRVKVHLTNSKIPNTSPTLIAFYNPQGMAFQIVI